MALRGNKQTYKIRHTQNTEGRVAAAREALGIAHKYLDTFEKEATALYAAATDDNKFFEIDRKSTRLNSSHIPLSRMPSSA